MNIMQLVLNDSDNISNLFHEIAVACSNTEHNFYYVFLSGKPSNLTQKYSLGKNIQLHYFQFSAKQLKGFRRLFCLSKVIRFMKDKKVDIVISHQWKATNFIGFCSKFVTLKKQIAVFHGKDILQRYNRQLFVKYFLPKADFVVVSQFVKDDLLSLPHANIKEQKVHVIYNGVDIDKIKREQFSKEEARRQIGLNVDDFVFGNVARLVPLKGQKILLQAFAQLKPNSKQKLVIIGDGRIKNELIQLSKELGIEHNVIFTGALPSAFRYMTAFDTFILSSLVEGLGVVLLEAMVAKIPVIGTKAGGIPEVLDSAGILVPSNNIEALQESMNFIYHASIEERAYIGEQLYKRLEEKFSIHRFHQAYYNLILSNS